MRRAVAVFVPLPSSPIRGTVFFTQSSRKSPVLVTFSLHGFSSSRVGKQHAIHIHEYGDLQEGCQSLGGHWNPTRQPHGSLQDGPYHHAGDLINNLTVQEGKTFVHSYQDPYLTLYGAKSIIGRSVVIHEGVDDLGLGANKESKITGNAGGRMTCAVIGWCCTKTLEITLHR